MQRQNPYIHVVKCIAFIFFCLTAFLTMEPLMSAKGMLPVNSMLACTRAAEVNTTAPGTNSVRMHCCKKKMHCSRQAQPKDGKEGGQSDGCQGNGCNPFMACAYGNFYLLEKSATGLLAPSFLLDKQIPANDNRLSSRLSESWHPPEPPSA
jgi:hypothetical protein